MATHLTINHHLLEMSQRGFDKKALRYVKNKAWQSLTWKEYQHQIYLLASALINAGLKPGDTVGIYSNTRYEWALADWACLSLKLIVVPIYQNSSVEEVSFILKNCNAKFVFYENKMHLDILKKAAPDLESQNRFVAFDSNFSHFHFSGEVSFTENKEIIEDRLQKTQIDDIASIVYTSGTSGTPKGVVLTHRQIISEVTEAFDYVGVTSDDLSLSILPYAHVLGRIEHWGSMKIGFELAFAESIDRIRTNLIEVKPTIIVAVPRIFEKIYIAVTTQLAANPLKSKIFRWAMKIGVQVSQLKQSRKPISILLWAEYQLAYKAALYKLQEAFGGRLRFAVTGGAPISKDICEFFHACDVLILEGYGLTETTAAITVNAPFRYRFGTVGLPLPDVKIKIAEDGEILVKSDKVMKEYYNNSQANKDSFIDGYFMTGDIGEILSSGEIKITDRKKDLIKTAGGKYVAPQKIEGLLSLHHLVGSALIHGDQKKYIVALISLSRIETEKWAREKNISFESFEKLTSDKMLIAEIKQHIVRTNSNLASYETIKKYMILPTEFTVDSGELTPSLKVKRKLCDQKYRQEILSLYS
ncbi:MAG: AMP-dependent synthetase/ligase [Pseudobdellovibrionaceae bacterium]